MTVSSRVAVLVLEPATPVIVTVDVSAGVVGEVVMVRVDVNGGFPKLGVKIPTAPEGKPDMDRLTGWLSPLTRLTVTV